MDTYKTFEDKMYQNEDNEYMKQAYGHLGSIEDKIAQGMLNHFHRQGRTLLLKRKIISNL